jgi:hypothetical protein
MPATQTKRKSMSIATIRDKARALGLEAGKMKKAELIHRIQTAEGYTPCYGKSNGNCVHTDCCFMLDCLKTKL